MVGAFRGVVDKLKVTFFLFSAFGLGLKPKVGNATYFFPGEKISYLFFPRGKNKLPTYFFPGEKISCIYVKRSMHQYSLFFYSRGSMHQYFVFFCFRGGRCINTCFFWKLTFSNCPTYKMLDLCDFEGPPHGAPVPEAPGPPWPWVSPWGRRAPEPDVPRTPEARGAEGPKAPGIEGTN